MYIDIVLGLFNTFLTWICLAFLLYLNDIFCNIEVASLSELIHLNFLATSVNIKYGFRTVLVDEIGYDNVLKQKDVPISSRTKASRWLKKDF